MIAGISIQVRGQVREMRFRIYGVVIAALALSLVNGTWALAQSAPANCRNTGSFDKWLRFQARSASAGTVAAHAFAHAHLLVLDHKVIGIDRGQRVFSQPFLEFANRMAGGGRTPRGQAIDQEACSACSRKSKRSSACRRR
jgi:membrane-bound lytic murein transglycosylase B